MAEADDEDDDDDNDDDGAGDHPVEKKPSMKRPAAALSAANAKRMKAEPAVAAPVAKPGKAFFKAKPGKAVFMPSYGIEESRSQVQCRTGLKASQNGDVIAPNFKYKRFANGKAGAINAAKKWLAGFKKTYKCI